jgi:hypothetical protein
VALRFAATIGALDKGVTNLAAEAAIKKIESFEDAL